MSLYGKLSDKLTEGITRPRLRSFLKHYQSNSDKILDLGSSNQPYADLFPRALSLDAKVKSNLSVIGDAHYLPFKDNSFGMIVVTEVLEHLSDPWRAVNEMKRVLKKGGLAIVTTRFLFPIHDSPDDYFRYTKYGLHKLFADWKIVKLQEESDNLESIGVLFQRLGFQSSTRPTLLRYGFFIISIALVKFHGLVKNSFGDITRRVVDTPAFTSGYYLVCQKI